MSVEREITEAVDLCRPDGRLSPDAVGWSRHPLHRTGLRGWGRSKRWEYWGLVTPEHIVGITVAMGRLQLVRLIGQPHVQRVTVGVGVKCDGENAHLAAGAYDTRGNLTAVGNQNFSKHGV